MAHIDFISKLHQQTKRDYMLRVTEYDKAACAEVAKQFGKDYWDGDRKYGYGGFYYDGRWRVVAEDMVKHYGLKAGDSILDVGCGKAFLLYDFTQVLPGLKVSGIDISDYAIENAKEEVKPFLRQGLAQELPYPDKSFDLVLSITTLHNLYIYDLKKALQEIERVSKKNSYIVLDSYRNERERVNLLYWQLTCECFFTPQEWEWLFHEFGYTGDYSFIYFE
ncbi:MAG: class I SAM-dependent methyltransferase [Chloroflexi bacterium]|nr:class I SAM-dependent methyltransferase [Chloroflexota bacterium]